MIHLAALDAAKTELYSAFQASGLKKLAAPRPDTLCCNSDLLPVHPAGVGNESGYGFTVARDHDLFAFLDTIQQTPEGMADLRELPSTTHRE